MEGKGQNLNKSTRCVKVLLQWILSEICINGLKKKKTLITCFVQKRGNSSSDLEEATSAP